MPAIPTFVWTSVGVAALVLLIGGLGIAGQGATRTSPDALAKELVQSAATYLKNAQQDSSMLQKFADAQFGLAYINAARMATSSDADLNRLTKLNVADVYDLLRTQQQEAHAWLSANASQPQI